MFSSVYHNANMGPGKRCMPNHGSACFHQGGNNPGWVTYILPFLALIAPQQTDLLRAEVMAFDSSFFEKVWPNIKKAIVSLLDAYICINWWVGRQGQQGLSKELWLPLSTLCSE